jgi:hypothetical protein
LFAALSKIPFVELKISRPPWERGYQAAIAFHLLDPAPSSAMPELVIMLKDPGSDQQSAYALAAIGYDGADVLITNITNQSARGRLIVLSGLGHCQSRGNRHISVIIAHLDDPEWSVRQAAILALGFARQEPDLAVPALIKALEDPRPGGRYSSVVSLDRYGVEARAALPALLSLLNGGKPTNLRQAIMQIDSNALTNASVSSK